MRKMRPFLDMVTTHRSPTWTTEIPVNGTVIPFKMDMGAEVTAISPETHKTLKQLEMAATKRPTQTWLTVIGTCKVNLSRGSVTLKHPVFVVDGLKTNLLGQLTN